MKEIKIDKINMKVKTSHYPVLPLRDMVIFPQSVSSLFVGREKSMEATRLAMEGNRYLVLVAQKDTKTVTPSEGDLHEIGVLCEILQLLKMPDSTYKILVEGQQRVYVAQLHDNESNFSADVALLEDVLPQDESLERQLLDKTVVSIVEKFESFNKTQNIVSGEFIDELYNNQNQSAVVDAVAHNLSMPFLQKQDILATLSLLERAEKVHVACNTQIEILKLEGVIHEKVRAQMDKIQRNFYLNEQIKVIKEELGESDADDYEKYRQNLQERNLPDEVKERVESEIKKLEKMPALSAESTVARNYIEWILELPWVEKTEDNFDIKNAQNTLDETHYGLQKVKDRILEFIAVKKMAPQSGGAILCLVGPPGVGKTSLAKALADSLNRKYIRISLGGVRDEAEIRGHRRTYIGSLPGRLITALKKVKVNNPVILLDELDKMSSDHRGNPAAALLEVLDPEQNKEFQDHYLELPFDLSNVLFIATANVAHMIPEPLLDRLELLEISGYTEQEKINICSQHLMPRQKKENGVDEIKMKYSDKSLSFIIRNYTRESGVRQLEREIAKICRKIARKTLEAEESNQAYLLDKDTIQKFLGPTKYNYGKIEKVGTIGKSNGLAWTSSGGDILYIEIALTHGKGKLTTTGNLGDVMKESVNTALGYVRSQCHHLGLSDDFFEKTDIYLHLPEGAIPKDGPSAGIAIATTLISALTQKPVKNTVAMTGEITLRGNVLPIGGLKEKSLAAFRGGISDVICPVENKKDLEDIPESVKQKLHFHFVTDMKEVLSVAFENGSAIFHEKPGTLPFIAMHLPNWKRSETGTSSTN